MAGLAACSDIVAVTLPFEKSFSFRTTERERFFEEFAALLPGPASLEAVAAVGRANWVEFTGPPVGVSDPLLPASVCDRKRSFSGFTVIAAVVWGWLSLLPGR